MSRIQTILPDNATGKLQESYKKIGVASQASILQIQSLHPQAMEDHFAFYKTLMFAKSPLSRKFREMIATSVSRWNDCHY